MVAVKSTSHCTLLREPIAFEAKNNFWILNYGQFKEDDCTRIARYATGNNDGANVRTPDDGSPKKDIPYINYTEYSALNEREWNELDEMFAEFNEGLTIPTPKSSADANKETRDTRPVTIMTAATIQGVWSTRPLVVLLDSGSTHCIIH